MAGYAEGLKPRVLTRVSGFIDRLICYLQKVIFHFGPSANYIKSWL